MRRRELLWGLAGLISVTSAAAQSRPRLIGFLGYGSGDAAELAIHAAFEQRLRELGWTSANSRVEYRLPAANLEKIKKYAAELIALEPDVIASMGTPQGLALKAGTTSIPIVFFSNTDPVGSGTVSSLAAPGGNITGFQGFEYTYAAKWMEILKEIASGITRVALFSNPDTMPQTPRYLEVARQAGPGLNLGVIGLPIHGPQDIDPAIASVASPGTGVVILPDSSTGGNIDAIVAAMSRYAVPAIYSFDFFPPRGGLVAYSYDQRELATHAAEYVDRILRGADPAKLPVQTATKFTLIINLKTATQLGLQVPNDLLARATQVIE